MKNFKFLTFALLAMLAFTSCDDDDQNVVVVEEEFVGSFQLVDLSATGTMTAVADNMELNVVGTNANSVMLVTIENDSENGGTLFATGTVFMDVEVSNTEEELFTAEAVDLGNVLVTTPFNFVEDALIMEENPEATTTIDGNTLTITMPLADEDVDMGAEIENSTANMDVTVSFVFERQ